MRELFYKKMNNEVSNLIPDKWKVSSWKKKKKEKWRFNINLTSVCYFDETVKRSRT